MSAWKGTVFEGKCAFSPLTLRISCRLEGWKVKAAACLAPIAQPAGMCIADYGWRPFELKGRFTQKTNRKASWLIPQNR